MDFYLFRVRAFPALQPRLFDEDFSPSRALRRVIEERPTSRPRRFVQWHIGNVESVGDQSLYFRLGKVSRRTLPMLDPETGDFTEETLDNAPSTHVLIDLARELCAIARNHDLSQDVWSVARRLQDVLNDAGGGEESGISFKIGPIRDPRDFLSSLRRAYSVKSFSYTFERENLIDAHRDFQRPLEHIADEVHAAQGKITVRGSDLEVEALAEITVAAAQSGDDASARVQLERGRRATTKRLRGDAASVAIDEVETSEGKERALDAARTEHDRIGELGGETA